MVTGLTAGTVGLLTAPAAEAATGSAAGRVFRDYNMNGAYDTTTSSTSPAVDVGVAGVTVTAYDKDNSSVGSATTGTSGTYSLSYTTTTTTSKVRLEFSTPTGMVASRAGTSGATNDSDVQFVSSGATNANYALTFPQDYAPANPIVAFARQLGAIKFNGTAQTSTAATVFSNPYNTRGTTSTTAATTEATYAQTGSVWGTATLGSDYIFSAAFLKRHAPIGPGGIGAVYLTKVGGAADAATFATVGAAGTDPRTTAQSTAQWFNDVQGYAGVGKVSLGGLVMAPDNSALYVVNLAAKTLVRIPITVNAAGVPSAGTQTSYAIPSPSCSGTLRPFGVGSGNGALWVTQTCAATAASGLAGYVYKFDPTTNTFATTPAVTVPLTGARGFAYNGNSQSASWEVWQDSTGTDVFPSTGTTISNPQPLLSDVAFDANGDMSIGIKDRFADQAGYAGRPIANDTQVYETMGAGDTVRACGGPTTWTLESNAGCGTRTGYGAGNGDGPGGGEFYADDFNTSSHDQVALGGLLQVPGFPHLIGTTFDPKPLGGDSEYDTNGYRFWSNSNGAVDATSGWRQIGTAARTANEESTYGKAGGMGDLDLLVTTPVEIGNRVWIDTDRDGIQDAEEAGVSGVQVNLYAVGGTAVLATTTTNSAGEYYFNDANFAAIAANTSYVAKLDRASDYASGGALFGYTTTTTGVGAKDTIDSDASTVSGLGQLAVKTPKFGADHSFDAGFYRKAVSVGDLVWVDTNKNGVQDSGEPGISGVTVTITGPGGAAVTDVLGNSVTSTTTNASGAYAFANLPALAGGQSYTVAISNTQAALADYAPTVTGAGTTATDSSSGTAVSVTTLVDDGDTDATLDFGFVRKAVSVGDFVWVDTNRDGVQTSGEPGLAGVTVTLVGPTGAAVTDVTGTAVGATTTNASGGYSFTNLSTLAAGQSYTVKLDNTQAALAAYVPTTTGAGTTATDSSNGSAVSVTTLTTNGASDTTLDFGFVRKAVSVGDFVWVDTNRDGVQDSGEPGLAGVTVTLVGPTGAAVTNVNGAAVAPVVTDANGAYSFGLLPALGAGQSYTVKIDNTQAALAAYVPTTTGAGTTATDSSIGSAVSVTTLTTNGASDTTLDFGFVRKAVSVGDFVWVDTNRDGVQDSGEPGLAGVTVTITRSDSATVKNTAGAAVTSTTTNATGGYAFSNLEALPAGTHYVVKVDNTQSALSAYVPTLAGVGSNAAKDSSTGTAESTNLTANGDADTTLDFGFVKPAVSVGDFVWVDSNKNGVQDAAEPGLAGITVTVVGPTGAAVTDVDGTTAGPVVTGANGGYSFTNLPALPAGQSYTVKVDNTQAALGDYVPTTTGAGTAATDSSNGSATSGNLTTDGASDTALDFGFVRKSVSVGDFVWVDSNRNGVQDAGEPGLSGVTVTLVGPGGGAVTANGAVVGATTTNASGAYSFANLPVLPAGQHYTVKVDNGQAALASYVPTLTGQGSAATDSSTSTSESGNLLINGASDLTLDFGFVKPAVSVGDFVWVDTNKNGVQNAGEPGLAGVTVTLVGPTGAAVTNVNGVTVGSTVTNAAGAYAFDLLPTLPAGQSYTVKVDNTQAALGDYVPTTTGAGTAATDSSDGSATSGNLTTDGASDVTLDFGFVRKSVSVGDYVWLDTNRDGIQQGSESGLAGVVLTLVGPTGTAVANVNGVVVGSTTTNAAGAYSFADLPALPAGQHYTVKVDNTQAALSAYVPTTTGAGTAATDSSTSTSESGNLPANGDSDTTLDFGFVKPAVSVGDFVFVDTNANGIQNAGEPGLAGVTVTLVGPGGNAVTNVNGTVVAPVVTDANGAYAFTLLPTLPAGQSYTVKVDNTQVALASYLPTTTGAGTAATDSSNGSAASGNLTSNGASDTTLDFGFVRKAVTVGDYVWLDTNRDGVQNASENGIAGVRLTIVGPTGTAVTDVNGAVAGAATTNAAGAYLFTNLPALPAGQHYTVKVDNTQSALSAYAPTTTGAGTTATDSSNGSAESTNLVTNGASDTTLDFGFVKPAVSVGDLVWVDGNGNGVQDAGEPGIGGVTLTIAGPDGSPVTDVNGNPVGATTTNGNGKYGFDLLPVLPAGQHYTVKVDNSQPALAGYVPTQTGQGAPATDSSNGSGETGNLTTNGASDKTIDFGFVAPVVPVTGVANLVVKKTVDNATPHVGDTVTYTVTVTNEGDAVAEDVVLKDLLPSGVTFVSASAPCTQAAGTVACDFGTIAAGGVKTVTITATVDNTPAGTTQERHGIDVQKAEAVLDLDAGQTASQTVACQPGYVVLDGSARVVHVDGGTGTLADVDVLESRASAQDTWKVTLENHATGRAQNKVFALCVKKETETVNGHSHQLQVSAAQVTETRALPAGRTDVTLSCAPGQTPVQPGWVLDGSATVPTSYPSGASSWVFGVHNDDATTGTFTLRCLKNQTSVVAGHDHDLLLGELFKTVTVPAGQDVDVVLDCADSPLGNQGAKGVVAGYDLAPGLLHLGNEPQPIRRVFTLSNPTGADLEADLWLLCMGTRTAGHDGSGTIVNTASATTSSPETTTNDNSSSATITVTAAPVVQVPTTNLKVAKSVSDTTPRVGDTVTYTLKMTNAGDTAATDVVLTDPLPAGVTYVAASSPCTVAGSTVTCQLGTIAAGATKTVTVQAKVAAAPAAGTAHAHQVDVQKAEAQINLAAGETRTVTVDCAPGYLATDGSGRIDQIDQGSGTPDSVRIAGSHATDADTWSVTLVNGATGNAQGKAFVVCAKQTTDEVDGHRHALVSGEPLTRTVALPTGQTEVALTCGSGTTPIQPGFQLTGSATVRTSYPVAGGWRFVIDNPGAAASGDFSLRCLNVRLAAAEGHQHDLTLTPVTQTVVVGAGQTVEVTTACSGDAKGVVAGYLMDKGLVTLGNDPRPIVRVSRFYNPTNAARSVVLSLLCLGNRTTANAGSGAVVNTAYASTSTPETTTGDNTASAAFAVDTTPIAAPASATVTVSAASVVTTTVTCAAGSASCRGTVSLVAAKTQKIAGKKIKKGTVLATSTFTISSGKVVRVQLKPTAAGKKVLRSKALKTAQVKVGKTIRTVTIRR